MNVSDNDDDVERVITSCQGPPRCTLDPSERLRAQMDGSCTLCQRDVMVGDGWFTDVPGSDHEG